MKTSQRLPNSENLSSVMAVILLSYVAAQFIQIPIRQFNLTIGGIFLPLEFSTNTIVSVLTASLAAAGSAWLVTEHPRHGAGSSYSHWLLPALTAWILSLPLANTPFTPVWWLAFAGGALLLVAVFLAEYVSVDVSDENYSLAAVSLSGLTYALFLILSISLKALNMRLALALPAIGLAAFLMSMRVQLLRGRHAWQPMQSVIITLLCLQVGGAIHYLPLSATGHGLALLGAAVAANSFLGALNSGEDWQEARREPLIALGAFWLLAIVV